MNYDEMNYRLKGLQLRRGMVGGLNPTVEEVTPYSSFAAGEPDPNRYPQRPGDWWREHGGEVVQTVPEVLSQILCLFNKDNCRPPANPPQQPPFIVQQPSGPPAWLMYAGLALVLVFVLYLIIKK